MKNNLKLKIFGTFLITLGLSLFVGFTRPKTAYSKLMYDWFWVNKTHFPKKSSILFLGDSRTYRGISTKAIKTVFPDQEVMNLGYSSGGFNTKMFEFASQQITNEGKVKIIVLGISPFSFTKEARKNEHFLQELNRPLAEIIERKYLNPLLTHFEPIKITDYQLNKNTVYYYQTFYDDGWVASHKVPEDKDEAYLSYKKALSKTEISEKSIKETLSFVDEMHHKGVKVYAYRPPSTQKMEMLENEISGFDEDKFRLELEKKGGKWIDIPNKYSFKSYDGSHLHFESAKKLSFILAKKIKQE
jgi:hypothetical protein